jgi:hypothetical protein
MYFKITVNVKPRFLIDINGGMTLKYLEAKARRPFANGFLNTMSQPLMMIVFLGSN